MEQRTVKIAVVEDDPIFTKEIQGYLDRYFSASPHKAQCDFYQTGQSFLDSMDERKDVLFLDINLPDYKGMELSRLIREKDKDIVIIFATELSKYAINGYSVGAFDFLLKPIVYGQFRVVLDRAMASIIREEARPLVLKTKDGLVKVRPKDVTYIEVINHQLLYHTVNGNVSTYGQLSTVEGDLIHQGFLRCNKFYLVNLAHVDSVQGYNLYIHGEELQISHRKRKEVLEAMASYLGE